jgi:hypothetical protein
VQAEQGLVFYSVRANSASDFEITLSGPWFTLSSKIPIHWLSIDSNTKPKGDTRWIEKSSTFFICISAEIKSELVPQGGPCFSR